MDRFLDRVIVEKRDEIAAKRERLDKAELLARAQADRVRDFRGALLGGNRIIAEVKQRSPRVARYRQADAVDDLAPVYERAGAAAISVVTDERNFGTSLDTVRRIRRQVDLPVLVKDFVIDPLQVLEARAAGADALLLIGRILSAREMAGLLDEVTSLGMHALVETHNERDIHNAISAGAGVIGINNRDLDALRVSLDHTRRLIRAVPPGVVTVSESGITSRDDIIELSGLGVDAFLIGGALLDSEDPGALLSILVGTPRRDSRRESRA